MTVRPTIRCLNEDLGLSLPPMDIPLNEIDHPLIKKSNDQFGDSTGARERISSVDDVIWFKVKVQRWRGAVAEQGEPSWLVAAGTRESGSPEDFYEALATSARAARARHNALGNQPSGSPVRRSFFGMASSFHVSGVLWPRYRPTQCHSSGRR